MFSSNFQRNYFWNITCSPNFQVSGNYNINVEALGISSEGAELILVDSLNGNSIDLMLTNKYSFSVSDTTFSPRMFLIVNYFGVPVSIENYKEKFVELYPNPNDGAFTMEQGNNNFNIMIIRDTRGRIIKKKRIKLKNSVRVRINDAGVYFVTLSNKTNSVVRKVVVR